MSTNLRRRGAPVESESQIVFRQLPELRCELKRYFNFDDDDKPRAKDPIISLPQIAARLSVTLDVLKFMITRGDLPSPPNPRAEGDRYDVAVERAWRKRQAVS